jgi:hypothetical protein
MNEYRVNTARSEEQTRKLDVQETLLCSARRLGFLRENTEGCEDVTLVRSTE